MSLSDPNCCSEPVSYAAVEEDCTSGLVIEVFVDLDKLALMLYFFMVAHKAACQTPVEGLFEVYENMSEGLLVLEVFFTEDL